jgi:hypothetical protein
MKKNPKILASIIDELLGYLIAFFDWLNYKERYIKFILFVSIVSLIYILIEFIT